MLSAAISGYLAPAPRWSEAIDQSVSPRCTVCFTVTSGVSASGVDIAAQAARVGGEQVLAGPAIRGQGVQVDTGAAKSAARDYLAAAGVSGSATIQGGDTLVVTTTDTYQTMFLGIIGLNRMTVTGHASARIIRAVGGVAR